MAVADVDQVGERAVPRGAQRQVQGPEIVVLFVAYAVTTAAIFLFFRTLLNSADWAPCLYYLATGVIAVTAYELGRDRAQNLHDSHGARAPGYLLIALIAALALAWIDIGLPARLIATTAAAGFMLLVYCRSRRWAAVPVFLSAGLGALAAVICFVIVSGMAAATVIAPESALAGLATRDSLYFSSLASMFIQFGMPSVGLDGVALNRYHTFSNVVLGTLARGAGVTIPYGYAFGMQILLLPLVFFSIAAAARAASETAAVNLKGLLVATVPLAVLSVIGGGNSFFGSESHALGLTMILLALPYLMSLIDSRQNKFSTGTLLIGCVLCIVAAATKISAGGVLGCGFAFVLLASRRLTLPQYAGLAGCAAFLGWLVLSYIIPAAHVGQTKLNPFHLIYYVPAAALSNLAIIAVAAVICILRWRGGRSVRWHQTLLLMLLVSTAPALAFQIDGASAYYYLNVGTWISFVVIAAAIIDATAGSKVMLVSAAAAVFALLCLAGDVLTQGSHYAFRNAVDELYLVLSDTDGEDSFLGQIHAIGTDLPNAPLTRLTERLAPFSASPDKPLVLFADTMWEQMPFSCERAPLFVPAYVGLPMLMGTRTTERDCDFGPHYGFSDYNLAPPASDGMTTSELCAATKERGFSRLLVVAAPDAVEQVDCTLDPPTRSPVP